MPFENHFIYFPSGDVSSRPSAAGLAYEEINLETEDGVRIKAWYIPAQEQKGDTTLLWFHGNAGNIGDRVGQLKIYHDHWRVHQMIVEYRGYGESEGDVSEKGTYHDGRAALNYLVNEKNLPFQSVVLFGRSLGAAVAVQLATEFPCAGLILESPFTSIRDMGKVHYPLLSRLIPLGIRYNSIGKIHKIASPLLILHGDRDKIVPHEQGKRLFEKAKEPKEFYTIPNAGHNDILMRIDETYHETVRNFIAASIMQQGEK